MTTDEADPAPSAQQVVARFALPMRVVAFDRLVGALEDTYGYGLMIVTGGPEWREDWMTIAMPEASHV